ncbi:MAG: protein translocase subunit SecF [Acidobacteriota bacterium]
MIRILKDTRINFLKYKVLAFALSGIIILSGLINIFFGKGIKLGVDFAGGTLIRIMFKNPVPVAEVRSALSRKDLGGSSIQEVGKGNREYMIRTAGPAKEGGQTQEIEAHEVMGNLIIETLRTAEDQAAAQQGLIDLNNIGTKEVSSLLQSSFPDEAAVLAEKIISDRVERGIIADLSELREAGISEDVIATLKEKAYLGSLTVLSRETVGPQVGKDLRKKAVQATVWALIGMLIYIGVRFKLAFGVSAILTLAHDVLVTMAIFSFTNRELNLPVIAAVLTIVGFSINDTIVIFDRVRDNLKILRKLPLQEILNKSVNQTLSRSILTSGTVFITILAIFLFGGQVINDFSFTMLVGVIEGSYSTIYMSCPIVLFWNRLFKPKRGMGR